MNDIISKIKKIFKSKLEREPNGIWLNHINQRIGSGK